MTAVTSRCKWPSSASLKSPGRPWGAAGCSLSKVMRRALFLAVVCFTAIAGWVYTALQLFFARKGRELICLLVQILMNYLTIHFLCFFSDKETFEG